MKVEEAAAVLGLDVNVSMEALKQKYRSMALSWHPDKCHDKSAKENFQQISIAYTKMVSARTKFSHVNEDTDEDDSVPPEDDVNELRAFMHMFMDLVGIFNEDSATATHQNGTDGASFGMMFGAQHDADAWSTEDEDEEDEDEDYFTSDESEDGLPVESATQVVTTAVTGGPSGKDPGEGDAEAKRKQRNLKKSERRKLQRERQLKEMEEREHELQREQEEKAAAEELNRRKRDEQRALQEAEDLRRENLFAAAARGDLETVKEMLEPGSGLSVRERRSPRSDNGLGSGLLHMCVSDFRPSATGEATAASTASRRLDTAAFLLGRSAPALDLRILDENGCNVLHRTAALDDLGVFSLLTRERESDKDRRIHLDLNDRCNSTGWAALHYAASNGNVDMVKSLLQGGALINLRTAPILAGIGAAAAPAIVGETLGCTALELVLYRIRNQDPSSPLSTGELKKLNSVADELTIVLKDIERVRLQREREKAERESKQAAERSKQAEKEALELELLERKQRQLREKQEKKKEGAKAASAAAAKPVATAPAGGEKTKKAKKKKDTGADSQPQPNSSSTSQSVGSATTVPSAQHTNTPVVPSNGSGGNIKSHVVSGPSGPTSAPTAGVGSESAEERAGREAQIKVDQRRINRAWNAKTEEDLRRSEVEKLQREVEKQESLRLQPMMKQQAQQQHLLAMQQQQQHTSYPGQFSGAQGVQFPGNSAQAQSQAQAQSLYQQQLFAQQQTSQAQLLQQARLAASSGSAYGSGGFAENSPTLGGLGGMDFLPPAPPLGGLGGASLSLNDSLINRASSGEPGAGGNGSSLLSLMQPGGGNVPSANPKLGNFSDSLQLNAGLLGGSANPPGHDHSLYAQQRNTMPPMQGLGGSFGQGGVGNGAGTGASGFGGSLFGSYENSGPRLDGNGQSSLLNSLELSVGARPFMPVIGGGLGPLGGGTDGSGTSAAGGGGGGSGSLGWSGDGDLASLSSLLSAQQLQGGGPSHPNPNPPSSSLMGGLLGGIGSGQATGSGGDDRNRGVPLSLFDSLLQSDSGSVPR